MRLTHKKHSIKIRIHLCLILLITPVSVHLQAATVNGFIRDNADGEPLSYANIILKDTELGAAAGQDGYYVIVNIPEGVYKLNVSYIGYAPQEKEIILKPDSELRIDVRMQQQAISNEALIVTAEREKFKKEVTSSQVTLDRRTIEVAPSFVEADVFRALQMLPGVQALNDFSPALYVRGSTPDQNLIMLDGITVYNPMHLGGIFSTFNTDAIKEADFYAGGFSAEHGGRLGSILNIVNREGNTEEFSGSANISLLSSKAMIEGPIRLIPDDRIRTSWMLAGRRTYFDLVFNSFWRWVVKPQLSTEEQDNAPDSPFPYYFYDFQGKLNIDLGSDHRLTWSSFYGDDVLAYDLNNSYSSNDDGYDGGSVYDDYYYESNDDIDFDWQWGNFTNSLSWRWLISPELILKTHLASSRFRFDLDMDNRFSYYSVSQTDTSDSKSRFRMNIYDIIDDRTVGSSLIWIPNRKHTLTFGTQLKNVDFDLAMIFDAEDSYNGSLETFRDTLMYMSSETAEYAVFLQDNWQISDLLSLQGGLRSTYYSLKKQFYTEPRTALKYFLSEKLSVKLSWGRYHQFLTVANPPDENLRFLDIWFGIPGDQNIPYADHYILGFEYLNDRNILFRSESYYKSMQNLLTLKPSDLVSLDEEGVPFIDPFNEFWKTRARAYGQEFLIKKISGKVRGWLGYTFSVTERRHKDQDWYFPKYDRTHTINAVADLQLNENLHFSTAFSYSSGNPYTPIIGRSENWAENDWSTNLTYYANDTFLYGKKHSARYPEYLRLDIALKNRKKTFYGTREWYFQILNATSHSNVFAYIYRNNEIWGTTAREIENQQQGVERLAIPMFPFMPTFGLKFEF